VNIVYKGLPVHYSVCGDGYPLIFLHGFNENLTIWDSIVPQLSSSYTCILIDLPGFGQSALPVNLTIKYMANAIYRIIQELSLLKPILIGHSMGGYVTLELVTLYPETFSGAALFHSTAYEDSEEKKNNRFKTLEFLNKNPLELFFKVFTESLVAPFNRNSTMLRMMDTIVNQTPKASVIAGIKCMIERKDNSDVLKNSNIPWLFITGKYDELLLIEQISLQASYCKLAMFDILQHSAHLGMIEEPTRSSEIIQNFGDWVQWIYKK